jgi:hypothetical protein
VWARAAQFNPRVAFGPRGCCKEGKAYRAKPSESGTRHYTPSVARLRDERPLSGASTLSSRSVLTERKKDADGKRLAACGQNIDQGDTPLRSHCCHLHAQANLSANHPNGVRRRHCPSCGGYEGVIESHSRVHPNRASMHLCRDTEQVGREVKRRLRADMRRVKTRALEAPPISPSVAKAS